MFFFVTSFFVTFLFSPVIPAPTRGQPFYWQNAPHVQESLFRMTFAQYLANPCGLSALKSNPRFVHPSDDSTEAPDVRRFVSAFANRYDHHNVTVEVRNEVVRELHLVFNEARYLVNQIYENTVFACSARP